MSKTLGIIAEDASDVEVLRTLIGKIAKKPFAVKKFCGDGCGKVRTKCRQWSEILKVRGCTVLLIVHDLDRWDQAVLLSTIQRTLGASPISPYMIAIPVQELEAWLLSDSDALRKVFNLKKTPKDIPNPEKIANPKEFLSALIRKNSNNAAIYVNTIHNKRIANDIAISRMGKCPSFAKFSAFIKASV